ncbi:OsmC family protein [Chryseobacterium populi]|uniref:Putative redox protein, regulator of disulfide bond formation n=1 Tax=Chryseobacterium populi TaxID=1144316 RepID=J3CLU0_9FLAO|nr:OsmC family protein [Chryseobacterium populi]EJL74219.1 putative redox protein, regulator of disulfide bond formation [Chryseobacterium populi]
MKSHHYKITVQWTGNKGAGTSGYREYERSHTISAENKAVIEGSSDPAFRGDKTRHNPEDLFLSSVSSCHMLWYLHFCSEAGIIVTDYTDTATGIMTETATGSGRFTEVTMNPVVTVTDESMVEKAQQLHTKANEYCFIANSVNFPVKHIPVVLVATLT